MIACCLEGLCTICLISTPLQLIKIQLFAYVCTFYNQVLVICWFCQLSSEQGDVFFFETLSPHTIQHVSIGLSKHIWTLAHEVIDVGGEGEQKLETKCINSIKS